MNAIELIPATCQLWQIGGIDVAEDLDSVTCFHVLFDCHRILMANSQRPAVIADEAHSSRTGEAVSKLKQVPSVGSREAMAR